MEKGILARFRLAALVSMVVALPLAACSPRLSTDVPAAQPAVDERSRDGGTPPQIVTPTPTPTPYYEPWRLTGGTPPPGLFPTPKFPVSGPAPGAGQAPPGGLPPGFTRGPSKSLPLPPRPAALSPAQQGAVMTAALADSRVGPRLQGKKYRVVDSFSHRIPAEAIDQSSQPCYNHACGTIRVFNYTDNEWFKITANLDTGQVVVVSVNHPGERPPVSTEELDIAKKVALGSSVVAALAGEGPLTYAGFSSEDQIGNEKRGARIILAIGDKNAPLGFLIVAVDLAQEKVWDVQRLDTR